MGHNDPARRAAIAASIGENETSLSEIMWSNRVAQQINDSRHDLEDFECYTEARRLYGNLIQLHETPTIWWRRQNQSSYFSRRIYKVLCEIWDREHPRSKSIKTAEETA